MKKDYKFIVYADIHYDRNAARCLTLEDCIGIESAVHRRAIEGGFDFTLFCGDRFFRREPEDEVKTTSDRVLISNVCRSNYQHFHLIGNHDWIGKNRKWHTSESLKGLPNIHVMDEPKTYGFNGVLIHALPAGFNVDLDRYNFDDDKLNIFAFHDTVKGSHSESGYVFDEGVIKDEFDDRRFSVVFAGDIHIPQSFELKNTRGGYVGSVLQRTLADALQPRGWLEVRAERSFAGWDFDTKFVPTRNFFSRFKFDVDKGITFNDCQLDEKYLEDCLINVVLSGDKKEVDRLADEPKWKNYQEYYNIRGLEISRDYTLAKSEKIIEMSQANTLVDDLETYLKSGFASMGNLDEKRILGVVDKVQGER